MSVMICMYVSLQVCHTVHITYTVPALIVFTATSMSSGESSMLLIVIVPLYTIPNAPVGIYNT